MPEITRVGVAGCGLMGSGIAEVCARGGLDVVVREVDDAAAAAGRARIEASLGRAVRAGKLTAEDRDAALTRIRVTTQLEDLADRELVIEAATENPAVKAALFAELDRAAERPDVILAVLTSPEAVQRVTDLVTKTLGKTVIKAPDRSGFVVNALLVPYLLAAIRMLDAGYATAEDIDLGMTLGCAHPMGPLRLSDLIGLDTLKAVADSMYEEYREPLYAPPPLLRRMTDAGLLGRKSGRGFYDYQAQN